MRKMFGAFSLFGLQSVRASCCANHKTRGIFKKNNNSKPLSLLVLPGPCYAWHSFIMKS